MRSVAGDVAKPEAGIWLQSQAGRMEVIKLNNGVEMPSVGLGTHQVRGYQTVYRALDAALGCGYRSVDTAAVYRNEEDIGAALRELLPKHGLARPDLFLTSKLSPGDQGPGAEAACLRSLERLACGYLDLYLVHWPGRTGWKSEDGRNPDSRRRSWEALETLYARGSLRAIGVSNYTPAHLRGLLASCRVAPAVLQVECHPRLAQAELLALCGAHAIHLQAYSSLGVGKLLGEEAVGRVAERRGRSPAQVLLRWALQKGAGVIPKSVNPERIAENLRLFDFHLSPEDMDELGSLDCGTHYCWDPNSVA